MREAARLAVLGLMVLSAVACDRVPATPPGPTPTLSTVTGITITGLPKSLSVGQTVQLTASVTVADGTSLRASEATWASSDVTVVTISSTGLLTVMGPGNADVTATFQSVRGVAHVIIVKPTWDISGVVHESAPTENIVLSGATVGIHFAGCPTCPHEGQETTTDDQGRFTLPGIDTAGFTLWVSKAGYEPTPFNVAQLPRDQSPDIGLNPDLAMVREIFEGVFQPSECSDPTKVFGGSCSRDASFPVHHRGATIVMEECYSNSFDNYESALFRGTPPPASESCAFNARSACILSHRCLAGYLDKDGWSWPVDGAGFYTIRVYGDMGNRFRAVFTRPN